MVENRHSKGDLQQMQAMPLHIKITMTERRIFDWYNHWNGDVYLSFSGGKDSTVLKHIIDNMGLNIPSVFINTGLEYPEIRAFAMSQDGVTALQPKMRFDEVIKQYGYPVISKEVSKNVYYARRGGEENVHYKKLQGTHTYKGKISPFNTAKYQFLYDAPFKIAPHCCAVMKKSPAHQYEHQTGRKPITAMMAEESRQRETSWIRTGCNSFDSERPMSKPMSFWTEQDVLRYIKEKEVPYCSAVYGDIVESTDQISFYQDDVPLKTTGMARTGCMFCMFGCHLEKEPNRFQKMKKTHPRQYEYCIGGGEMVDGMWQPNKQGLGLGYVLDYINVKY